MQPCRRQPKQDIARPRGVAAKHPAALDYADNEAGQVVLARLIEVRQFRSFPADQRATYEPAGTAHAFDHLLDDIRVHPTHAQVVEEEERLGAAGQNVVDAVVHDIRPHRGMDSHGKGDFQLRAHAVGARDQHRFSPAVTVKRKQGAEPADAPKHVAGKGPPSQPADALLGLLGEGNTDASVGVSHCRKSLSAGLRGSWNPCWVFDPGGRRMTSNLANCDLAG